MNLKPKVEVLPSLPHRRDPANYNAFDDRRLRQDLEFFSDSPSLLAQWIERARIRFQKRSERAVLERWIEFYETGSRMIAAKADMERKKSEYLQLAREHEVKEAEKSSGLAKHQADIEEHTLRRDKAAYQRQHLEDFMDNPRVIGRGSEEERQMHAAQERSRLNVRWNLNKSLSAITGVIELQHWRREQRDLILRDRGLSPEEQSEDLQFVDELYDQKRKEIKTDTRIFEE